MTFLTTGICGLYLAYFRSFHTILQDKTVADFSRIRTRILRVAGSSADHHHGSGNVYSYNSNRSEHIKLGLKLVPGQAKSFWVQGGGGSLRRFVCAYQFAVSGSNPKQTINDCIVIYCTIIPVIVLRKGRK